MRAFPSPAPAPCAPPSLQPLDSDPECRSRGRVSYEVLNATYYLTPSLLLAGELGMLRDFLAHSLVGAAVDDEAVRAGVASYWKGAFGAWKVDDGHCLHTLETWLLIVRGLMALLEDVDASRAALQAWLPPPAELLRMSEFECGWRALGCGAVHPALLCARLHGERLSKWDAAAEVAEGVLRIELFQPMVRTEAYRLLGCAHAALGRRTAACEAAERAATEAAKARYAWLELLSLVDLLRWSEAPEVEGVRNRVRSVAGRLAASAEQLAEVVGEGVL